MKLSILAVGPLKSGPEHELIADYAKRFSHPVTLGLTEIPQASAGNTRQIKDAEGAKLQKAITRGSHVVALDVLGSVWDTHELARQLSSWKSAGSPVCLLIGGPEGLSDACLARADQTWSLSRLTFPHPLVRILVAEQLYRAESILRGHPYHRA